LADHIITDVSHDHLNLTKSDLTGLVEEPLDKLDPEMKKAGFKPQKLV